MRNFCIIALCTLLLAVVAAACSAVGCTENRNSLPLAGFYSYQTGQAITVDSLAIGGVGAPADSLLLTSSSRGSQVYLPFRAADGETTFYIAYEQKALAALGLTDVISFTYTSVPFFASEDCGALYHYRITGVEYTTNLIDSVGVSDSLVTNFEHEIIQIFFRTANPDDDEDDEI